MGNNFLDQHVTYSANIARTDVGQATGAFYGDGQWFAAGRLTALPLYEESGRHFLHLGVASSYRNGTNNTNGNPNAVVGGVTTPNRLFQLRARPQFRDDDPAGGGGIGLANANSNRMIDTGIVSADNDVTLGTELLYVRGPLSLQAEYGWNFLNGVNGAFANPGGGFVGVVPPFVIAPSQNYVFNGGYIQAAYTLTGEARGYDRNRGTLSRPYFVGGPFSNAFAVWNSEGGICRSLGAVELAVRYDYTSLNSGVGAGARINGGVMQGVTLGLNWYLNSNMSVMFDYVHDQRYAIPAFEGSVDGFGSRVQLSF